MSKSGWGKADLHIHSAAGDGLASPAQILEYVEHETDLDLIAITDHDLMDGALEARDLAAGRNYRFQVLVGMEVTTLEGHLLAYDLKRPIRMLQPLARTIRLVHEQGGFCVVPHPMSWLTRSIGRHGLMRIMASGQEGVYFDGIEVINPSFAGKIVYHKILALNQVLDLPETAGSDSHTLDTIGTAYTLFQGHTAAVFRRALRTGATRAGGRFWSLEDHRRLASIAGQQVFKSWVILPGQHIKRALAVFLAARTR
ncbi:MAG: CehA/McbA family metallohydrolase [Anaerolineae bacterium]